MHRPDLLDRRRVLKTLFCSSACLGLNLRSGISAEEKSDDDAIHLLAIGDFGTTGSAQRKVAEAMEAFRGSLGTAPEAMLLLGDNFYSKAKDGFSVDSERWRTTFEEAYPPSAFPGPCWAILGNHDYHDNEDGEKVQLAYAARGGTRWRMPAKWYRFDLGPADSPFATVIALDSNLPTVSGGRNKKSGKIRTSLTQEEAEEQLAWLEAELKTPRAPFTLAMGHHPLYSNGAHGDTKDLVRTWNDLFQEHRVHAYLCGHDHDLQHLELEGLFTSHLLSGGGGARVRKLESGREIPFGQDINGFTHLRIARDRIVFTHRDADNRALHRFTKHLDGSVEIG